MKLPHIFYDADGTIFDSLPAHILFLHDMSKKFNMKLDLPNPNDHEASKRIVSIPMSSFITKAGFPGDLIHNILEIYKTEFNLNTRYDVNMFPGMATVIRKLYNKTFKQGIVSANYLENIEKALAKERLNHVFRLTVDKDRLDKFYQGLKSNYLEFYYKNLKLNPKDVVFIGDTKGDLKSAETAGVNFIGVSYGWDFSPGENIGHPLANSPEHLEEIVMSMVQ